MHPVCAQGAFEAAIALADGPEGSSYQWYPYSYICGYLVRRAVFIIEHLGKRL